MSAPLLEVRGLRVRFPGERGVARAVDGVDFSVGEGEIVGLVGESGCGKSVTALALSGLVPPPGEVDPSGSIRVAGEEMVGAPEAAWRRLRGEEVATVFQEPMSSLDPVQRVGRQVVEGIVARRGRNWSRARPDGIRLLTEVGIPDPERGYDRYAHELSGGQRQRVLLAAALALEPRLLVADEPTTALDATVQAQILDLILSIRDRRGMGVLFVTHDLAVVSRLCDRVLVMYAGRIVEHGSTARVLEAPAHPYTRGLLGSLPRRGERRRRLRPIPGVVPPATDWPSGCRFRERCPLQWERCADEPELHDVPRGGRARCWLAVEPARDPAR